MFTKQQGSSVIQSLIYLVVVIVILTAAFKLVPVYSQNYTIQSILDSLQDNTGLQQQILAADTTDAITSALETQFSHNDIHVIKPEQISITPISGGNHVTVNYDVTEPLYGNISLLIHFTDSADIKISNE